MTREMTDEIAIFGGPVQPALLSQTVLRIAGDCNLRVNSIHARVNRLTGTTRVRVSVTGDPDAISDFEELFIGDLGSALDPALGALQEAGMWWIRRRRRRRRTRRAIDGESERRLRA
jgi:hypothetical protein